ncbi:hypothetical protein AB0D71_44090 [Streptomyces avermitilis]|uniref:hypothetical protein n=1 Tax=Streptomyces avermitilis TaxID=33903 RepID=UPI0033D0E397
MYNMCAEHLATGSDPGLLWHVLNRDDRALGGRALSGKATVVPEGAMEREDYCRHCLNGVAAAVESGLVGASADARGGEHRR